MDLRRTNPNLLSLEQNMKLTFMFTLMIACFCVSVSPVLAQTPTPVTLASNEGPSKPLPEAPSAVHRSSPAPPAAAGPIAGPETRDMHFMLVNGLMFSSSIANVELTNRCFDAGACTAVPGPLRSRGALYGVGLPIDVAVTVMGYRLKRAGHRWWFVPAAAVTAGNIIYSIHAARYSH
jgi:hypothetical protein